MSAQPAISVAVQIGKHRRRSLACLRSLLKQELIDEMEILVDDFAPGESLPQEISEHPAIRIFPRSAFEPIGTNKARAVREAHAPVVAFIEDHCLAQKGWAREIVRSHAQGWHAIGGQVINGNPGVGISDFIEIMNYHRWLPPVEAGKQTLLVGHNSAYDREVLLSYQDQLEVLLRCDPVLQWQMAADGFQLYMNPAIRFEHINETEVQSIMRGYFLWNRIFAPTRAQQFHWSTLRKLAWIAASPFIPAVRLVKLFRYIVKEKPRYLPVFLKSLPIQLLAHSAAAAGQALGLSFGVGNAEHEFLRYELGQPRRMNQES